LSSQLWGGEMQFLFYINFNQLYVSYVGVFIFMVLNIFIIDDIDFSSDFITFNSSF